MNPALILLAETQCEVRHDVRDFLEQSGFRAMAAASAHDIFHALDETSIDAVVLDAALRGVDGLDLCRDVRERSDVPIILVGANISEVDRVVGLELGADDYMVKPYSARELAARLRAVMRRGRNERMLVSHGFGHALFDGWTVDFGRREVIAPDGALVSFTAAEFSLLAVFVDHPQTIVARARLMELAGVRDGGSSDRSVDVLVSRLRRKLSRGGNPAPIVTVRSAGYMFSAPVERR
ncbi:response regulator transcription factor [Sphingobium olei]|uniref:Response regulator transcription factor n=1 Tax=Sphingobium olei TaxID=420955 RepID=A0ABW3NW90_9SPHN|nr:response regulator transcription factor [Sphingobium sp.]